MNLVRSGGRKVQQQIVSPSADINVGSSPQVVVLYLGFLSKLSFFAVGLVSRL